MQLTPEDERELRRQQRRYDHIIRGYRRQLAQHPDCIDPAHPGCEDCDEDFELPSPPEF